MMELKITADRRFLEAIEKLAEAIHESLRGQASKTPKVKMPACEAEEYAAPVIEPERTEPAAKEEPPAQEETPVSAEEVKRQAIQMIQGGLRDAVKALLEKYGVARVTDIADEKLAEFKKDLDGLK